MDLPVAERAFGAATHDRIRTASRGVATYAFLALLGLLAITPAASAGTFTVIEPRVLERDTGKPSVTTLPFEVLNPDTRYTLRIYNGGVGGVKRDRVASAVVALNGAMIAGPDAFSPRVFLIERTPALQTTNELAVELRGKPGSKIALELIGEDTDQPRITAQLSHPANDAGWHNREVTVTFECSDPTSGIARCPDPVTVTTEGADRRITGIAEDLAGNTAEASVTVSLDRTAPTLSAEPSPVANSHGWHHTDVTVAFSAEDDLSGIEAQPSPIVLTEEGRDQTAAASVTDRAGNTAQVAIDINIDKSAPAVSVARSPLPNTRGWNNTDVEVAFDCSDVLSGVDLCSPAMTVATEGAGQKVTGTATDLAGNSATAETTVNLDKTPPVIAASPDPAPNAQGWNNTDVTVSFDCGDDLSGIVHCTEPVMLTGEGRDQPVEGSAEDAAGNSATTSTDVSIDKTAPVVAILAPSDGLSTTGDSVDVAGTAGDANGLSGVTVNGDPATLSAVDEFFYTAMLAQGTNAIEVLATDVAGNSGAASITVTREEAGGELIFSTTPVTSAQATQLYSYDADVADPPAGVTLTYTLVGGPAGMSLDTANGVLSWIPLVDDVGDHAVELLVTDGENYVGHQAFTLTVSASSNAAPSITSTPVTETLGGKLYTYNVEASDADAGDSIVYALTEAPPGMSIDTATGVIAWSPGSTASGVFPVAVRASDSHGGVDEQRYDLTVEAREFAPRIVSAPETQVTEGDQYRYQVQAEDPNAGDTLTYGLRRAPQGMTIDTETGELSWSVDNRYAASGGAGGACYVDRPDSAQFKPRVKWTTRDATIGTPVVGPLVDTNGDGRTDTSDDTMLGALVGGGSYPRIAVLRGDTGEVVWKNETLDLWVISIGLADVDRDGWTELFVYTQDNRIAAINGRDGSVKWQSEILWDGSTTNPSSYKASSFSFADLDGDGLAEVLFGGTVLNHNGSLRWRATDTTAATLAVDLDLDGAYEVIAGNRVYDRNGNLLFNLAGVPYTAGGLALAGLDDDPYPEIVYHHAFYTDVFEHDGTLKWSFEHESSVSNAPPAVADLDGDGWPEIGGQSRSRIDILDRNGQLRTSRFVDFFDSSAFTGATAFDFLGDGSHELVVNDHSHLYVMYGDKPVSLYEWVHGSYTQQEYAAVADIDNDGHAEFVMYGGDWVAYEEADDLWPATRAIWNQYHYYPGVINPDGTVPTRPVEEWTHASTFRTNPALQSPRTPDLQITDAVFERAGDLTLVRATIANHGEAPLPEPVHVNLYDGVVDTAHLLGTAALDELAASGVTEITVRTGENIDTAQTLIVAVDPDGRVAECAQTNNTRTLPLVEAEVTDSAGLKDTQLFALTVTQVNNPPQIVSQPVTTAARNKQYQYALEAVDPDEGDRVTDYRLVNAPDFMRIDDQGVINAMAQDFTSSIEGDYDVVVEACDPAGACAQQAYTLTVGPEPENQLPTFLDPPASLTVNLGELLVHRFVVEDPDGGVPFVDLRDAAAGMSFDPVEHTLRWVPEADQAGIHTITLMAYDDEGELNTHTMTVKAVDLELENNHNPKIASSHPYKAYVGLPYEYDIIATDEDGDELSYALLTGPADMVMDGSILRWTPSADQVGYHSVNFSVTDEHGAGVYASYTVRVLDETPTNQPPAITSTPPASAVINQYYEYVVTASDPDGDALTYAMTNPSAASMAFDPATRTFSWTPTSGQLGQQSFYIEVSDGRGGKTAQGVFLTVRDDNQPPEITSTPPRFAVVGETYRYAVQAYDINGDALSYSLTTALDGMGMDAAGEITWTPQATQIGDFPVEVTVTDGRGGVTRQLFHVYSDTYENQLPRIDSAPATLAFTGKDYNYAIAASDPRGGALDYVLAAGPDAMYIDLGTGRVSWRPEAADIGTHTVAIEVGNSLGTRTQEYLLTVRGPNNAPVITTEPATTTKAAHAYRYDFKTEDADADPLSFTLVSAPAGMTLDETGTELRWTPDQAGEHTVTLRVDDGYDTVEQSWTLTVLPEDTQLAAEASVDPEFAQPGEAVAVNVQISGAAGAATISGELNGAPVGFDGAGNATVSATAAGAHVVSVTVSDEFDTVDTEARFYVVDETDTTPPAVTLAAPLDGATVTAPTDIVGSVQDDALVDYVLAYAPAGTDDFTVLDRGTASFAERPLAQFDPSLLVNGLYTITLQGTDANGRTGSAGATVRVEGNLKVGNFSFTVLDLEVPVSGIPIRVTRTYDTRRKAERLDFGHGWSVGYQDVKVEESRLPGTGWALNEYPTGPLGTLTRYCIEPLGRPTVAVTLPDGRVEAFEVRANPECADAAPVLDVELAFVPQSGTLSTLAEADPLPLRYSNGALVLPGEGSAADPDRYRLTTQEGFVYTLDQAFGIDTVRDPNGNTLTYTSSGILHSDGRSVLFERDAQGRITAVTDPNGNRLTYDFDAEGNLTAATDAAGHTTRYTYDATHALLTLKDPLGRTPIRNIYDDDGRLIGQEDADGHFTEFNHDLTANQSVVTDRLGRATVLTYDERGNVTERVDAAGGITNFTYDEFDNPLSETDPLGLTTTATFDDRRNQLTRTDPLGHTVAFSYNLRGQELTVTDARGNTFENAYDGFGNLLTVTDPLGHTAGQNIDAQGRVSLRQDALGHATTFVYDQAGNVVEETDPLGHTVTRTFDANGNPLTETRTRVVDGAPVSETTRFEYDALNRLIATTDPLGHVTRTEYDAAGNEAARIDALGRRTEMDHDVYGRLIETRYPDGTTETNEYDAEGNLVSTTDRINRTTTYDYDALDRQVRVTWPDGTVTETEYDAAGRVTAEIDEKGNRTEYQYDAAGRRIRSTDALGNVTTFAFDPDGNLTARTDAKGQTTTFEYDALDRRTRTVFPDGTVNTQAHDALGRVTATTDAEGRTTRFEYDALGRLTRVTDAAGGVTAYTYDAAGNKLTQTDANGHTTRWTYDAQGRVLSRTLPEGQTETFAYDASGNRTRHTDFNGETTTFEYDLNDRLVRTIYPDGSEESITYDAVGHRTAVTDSRGTTTYDYDARDRLIREVRPEGTTLDYQYDPAGNRTKVTTTVNGLPETVTYGYDALNRLETVTDAQGRSTAYTYDENGNRATVALPNGLTTTYTYDSLNRLTALATRDLRGTLVERYDYTLSPTGRRSRVVEADGRTVDYGYDALYRLIEERITPPRGTATVNSYQYDAAGNRTSSTEAGVSRSYSYDANDRMLTAGAATYTYDANGNLVSESDGANQTTYTYDAENRLAGITRSAGGLITTESTYAYDPDGNRIEKTENGAITKYLVDRNRDYAQVLKELDGANNTLVSYLYGDDLLRQTRGAADSYYLYDGLGSTRGLTDTRGSVTDSYDYDAYGNLITRNGFTDNNYLYTGEQFDGSLGQYYLRARYYDPQVGRFTQMDSFQGLENAPVTLHKYLYANADPVNTVDPSGKVGDISSFNTAFAVIGTLATAYITSNQIGQSIAVQNGEDNYNNSNVISLDEWRQRRNATLTSNGDGGNGGGDDGYCRAKREQLLSRMLMPILLTRSGLMGTWQYNQFVKKFNTEVERHNIECPEYQVQPLTFL